MFGCYRSRLVASGIKPSFRWMSRGPRPAGATRPPLGLVKRFRNMLNSNPLATNCIVFGSLSGLAEFSQQTWLYKVFPPEEEKKSYDLAAIGRYVFVGCAVFAPILTAWYRWLDRRLPGTTPIVVLQKVVLDIVILDIPYYAAFYAIMNTLEGKSLAHCWQEMKAKLLETVIYSIVLWTPAQVINFKYLPPRARVIFIALVTFLEMNVLAMMKRAPHDKSPGEDRGNTSRNIETEIQSKSKTVHFNKEINAQPTTSKNIHTIQS